MIKYFFKKGWNLNTKYGKLFKESNIDYKPHRKTLIAYEIFQWIALIILAAGLWLIGLAIFTDGDIAFLLFIYMFTAAWVGVGALFVMLYFGGKLEQVYFDEFLSKKVKVFYSMEELREYNYNFAKDSNVSANTTFNINKALMQACKEAYDNNYDAILITSQSQSTIVSGSFNSKGKGSLSTSTVGNLSVRFISNLKKKEASSTTSTGTDIHSKIEELFKLKEKGALSEEEFIAAKAKLLIV